MSKTVVAAGIVAVSLGVAVAVVAVYRCGTNGQDPPSQEPPTSANAPAEATPAQEPPRESASDQNGRAVPATEEAAAPETASTGTPASRAMTRRGPQTAQVSLPAAERLQRLYTIHDLKMRLNPDQKQRVEAISLDYHRRLTDALEPNLRQQADLKQARSGSDEAQAKLAQDQLQVLADEAAGIREKLDRQFTDAVTEVLSDDQAAWLTGGQSGSADSGGVARPSD